MSEYQRAFILSFAWGGLYAAIPGLPIVVGLLAWRGSFANAIWIAGLAIMLYVEVLVLLRIGWIEYPATGISDE